MQGLDPAGDVLVAGGRESAELFAKILEHRQRDDRRSVLLDVQSVAERRLEQIEKVLPLIAW